MKKVNFKSFIPYLFAFIIFVIISYAYFPQMFEGKVINQSDISSWKGAAQEIFEFRKATGQEPLWTGSMFGGMPANMISIYYPGNYTTFFHHVIYFLSTPAAWFIVSMLGFYLLLLCFKVNKWLAIPGAIAFAFCSYNFEIVQVGHLTKMQAISYMPWVLASVVYAYRHRAFPGAVFLGITLSLEVMSRHPQITYYLGFIVLAYIIGEGALAYKNKAFPRFIKASLFVLLGAILGFGSNVNSLWPTAEYSKYTMRGGSELSHGKDVNATGLTKEYATAWSYGIEETPNLFIPNFNGGGSGSELSKNSETYKVLKQGGAPNAEEIIRQMPTYWGPQAFTAGPMYMGAISVFLFVLGLVLIKGPMKWWIAGVSLLALFLSWGQHFMWFSSLFFDYVPLYSKFRVPSMILVILQITIPLLGFYTISQMYNHAFDRKTVIRGLKIALGITAGFCALFAIFPSLAGSFSTPADARYPEWLQQTLPADRQSMLRADAFRSLVFILLSAAVLWLGYNKKLKFGPVVIGLSILILADMWTVNKRFLNDSHFVQNREYDQQFQLRKVDRIILQDKDPDYRVLDLSVNTFNDAHVSYHHKTIGGYSATKFQRYQDLIDYHIVPEIQLFAKELQKKNSLSGLDSLLSELHVLNMLNAKYIVVDPNGAPVKNDAALGHAWFVQDYKSVKTADEEILSLNSIHPGETAIINETFLPFLNNQKFRADTNAFIKLLSYAPNQLEYKYHADSPQLAVFSEIYYPIGWKAYIDGKETPHFRANYILRSMVVPAGDHTITFKYAPKSYYEGATISRIASGLLILLLIGLIVQSVIKYLRKA